VFKSVKEKETLKCGRWAWSSMPKATKGPGSVKGAPSLTTREGGSGSSGGKRPTLRRTLPSTVKQTRGGGELLTKGRKGD